MNAEEIVGRKQIELESLHDEYDRLLAVLSGVLFREIASWRVSVDLTARTWKVDPLPPVPVSFPGYVPETGVSTED